MSDFAQAGLICTLQRLNDSHLLQVEAELAELTRDRPIALVLPCQAGDLASPAFAGIVRELAGASFLREIALTMNGLTAEDFAHRHATLLDPLPQRTTLLFNPGPGGKGANLSAALAHLSSDEWRRHEGAIVVTQDCDVASFRRADLARLCFAVAHPELGFRFAKAYYSRVTDRLYGRVSRLFLAPLLHAVVRVAGHHPLVDFLLSFRYPLAGEVALDLALARTLAVSPGWGLEIGQLCEIFRRIDPRGCCQVDGGTGYDHRHHPADRPIENSGGSGNATSPLARMATEIARELFAQLSAEGLPNDPGFRAAVTQAYRREAAHALHRSASLALINCLPFDAAAETATLELFAERLSEDFTAGTRRREEGKQEQD